MDTWRLIRGDDSAEMNMAIDKAIFRLVADGTSPPTLRLYTWTPPAVSLGYFQRKRVPDPITCQRFGLHTVRRPSGGRAVLHKGDLTYAVIGSVSHGIPNGPHKAYRLIGKGILLGLRSLGVAADLLRNDSEGPMSPICFLRPSSGEIVYEAKKFVGNAQAWSGKTLLQQGSIAIEPQIDYLTDLFRPDRCRTNEFRQALASRITALDEILGRHVSCQEVAEALIFGLSRVLGVKFAKGELTREERTLVHELLLHPELSKMTRGRFSKS